MNSSLLKNNLKAYFNFLDRNKLYTAINVFGLSVSLMFVILISNYIINESFKDTHVKNADRIYALGSDETGGTTTGIYVGEHLKAKFPQIEESCWVSMYFESLVKTAVENGDFLCMNMYADPSFFNMFSIKLHEGMPDNAFAAGDGVMISRSFAEKLFPNESALGKSITFQFDRADEKNAKEYVVSGVYEDIVNSIFSYTTNLIDVILTTQELKNISLGFISPEMKSWGFGSTFLLAKKDEDLRNYEAEFTQHCRENYLQYKNMKEGEHITAVPFKEMYFSDLNIDFASGNKERITMTIILGIVILLFAILNYINLTVSQISFRAKEMATRRLLGITSKSIFWKTILESAIITTVAFILGFLFAIAAQDYFNDIVYANVSVFGSVSMPVIIGYLALVFITSFISGIIPAYMISRSQPVDVVKGEFSFKSKKTYGKIILVVQNCITVILLCMVITIHRQINHMMEAPLNYNMENIISISFPYSTESLITGSQALQLKDEIGKLPYVEDMAFCSSVPSENGPTQRFFAKETDERVMIRYLIGDEAYFRILGFKIKHENNLAEKGWYFTESIFSTLGLDENEDIINLETFQRQPVSFNVSGVIEDIVVMTVDHRQFPVQIYKLDSWFPMSETDKALFGIELLPEMMLIKVNPDIKNPSEILEDIRGIYNNINSVEADHINYLIERYNDKFRYVKRPQTIVSIFAIVAIIISSLGLLAMSTYYTQQKKKSIAIKKIFGATTGSVLVQTIRYFIILVGISFIIAIPIAYYVIGRWLQNFSYRIEISPIIFILAGLLTALIALITVWWQSSKAAAENPANTIKS